MNSEPARAVQSDKKYSTAVVLVGFFGLLGIHHFYLGRWAIGIFDLGLSILAFSLYMTDNLLLALILFLIDLIHTTIVTFYLFTGQYKDSKGSFVIYPGQKI